LIISAIDMTMVVVESQSNLKLKDITAWGDPYD